MLVNDREHAIHRPQLRMFIPGRRHTREWPWPETKVERGPNVDYYTTRCDCDICTRNQREERRVAPAAD